MTGDVQRLLSLVANQPDEAVSWDHFSRRVLTDLDAFSAARRRAFFLTVLRILHGDLDVAGALEAASGAPLPDDDAVQRYLAWLDAPR